MAKSYTRATGWGQRLRQLGLTALLAGGAALAAQAQGLNYTINSATNTTSTFTDLGTAGIAISTANPDDANSAAQNIGFTFNYNGQAFTQFVLNTNGLIRLGSAGPSALNMFVQNETGAAAGVDPIDSPDPADVNLLMPFNFDLEAGTGTSPGPGIAEYRVATSGISPNQVCVIQWKNVHDKAANNASQYGSFTFQLKLYEGSNQIEFVYSPPTAATTGTEIGRYATIGIKGSGPATGQYVQASKNSSLTAWSGAGFINTTSLRVFFRRTVVPDLGRTFRFRVAPANDAAINGIYTLGKLPIPSALPTNTIQVAVQNAGSATLTNLPVTLSVSGANTFGSTQTVASLAPGASTLVSFPYPTTLVPGINDMAASVPVDAILTNNSATWQQEVNTTATYSYVPSDQPGAFTAFGGGVAGLIFANRYTTAVAAAVPTVRVFIANTGAVGKTVAGVVLTPAGVIQGRSADYVVQPADVGTYKTFTIASPPTVAAGGSFLAGLAQLAYTGTQYFVVGAQVEAPARATTYYTVPVAGGTPTDFAAQGYRLMIEAQTVVPSNCAAVTGLAAANITATSASLSFTDPAAAASYQVIYGPAGFDPNTAGTTVVATASPYTLAGLQPGINYQVYIRSNCAGGGTSYLTGPVAFSTPCVNSAAITGFPYTETFDSTPTGQTLPCGITTLDANADGTTWATSTDTPYSGTRAMRYNGLAVSGLAANDWFFTPGLALAPATASTRYQVSFRYRASGLGTVGSSNYTEALEVKSGLAATVAGQTNQLYTNNNITNLAYNLANGTSTPAVAYLPAGTSTQYVGFHVRSAADQGSLYIDDVNVAAVTVTAAAPEALLRAVSVFPNPSAGVFSLAINGANAKAALGVRVINTLGQLVYVGTARDNYTTKLDLSHLVPGLYHLQVQNGDESLTRQISILK